jgi:hypothetical protein
MNTFQETYQTACVPVPLWHHFHSLGNDWNFNRWEMQLIRGIAQVGINFSRVRLFSSLTVSRPFTLDHSAACKLCIEASVIGLKRSEREDYSHPSSADVTNPYNLTSFLIRLHVLYKARTQPSVFTLHIALLPHSSASYIIGVIIQKTLILTFWSRKTYGRVTTESTCLTTRCTAGTNGNLAQRRFFCT